MSKTIRTAQALADYVTGVATDNVAASGLSAREDLDGIAMFLSTAEMAFDCPRDWNIPGTPAQVARAEVIWQKQHAHLKTAARAAQCHRDGRFLSDAARKAGK